MKKILFFLIIATTLFGACKNYEDGPLISFRKPTNLIIGKWVVEKFMIDDVDSTQLFNDSCGCQYTFNHEGSPDIRLFLSGCKFGLVFSTPINMSNHKKTIEILYSSDSFKITGPLCYYPTSYILTITRLTREELWLKSTLNNKNYLIKLKHS